MTDSANCVGWQVDWVGCGWGHSCPKYVPKLRTTCILRPWRQPCGLIPTTNGPARHSCDQYPHTAGLKIMRVSPRLARRSRYDSAKRRVSPSTPFDHLKVHARLIESVASIIWNSANGRFDARSKKLSPVPFSAKAWIGNLPLQRPRLEVSYHRKR